MRPVFTFTPATTFNLPLLFEQLIIFTCAGVVTTHDTFIHYQFAPKSQNFSQHFVTLLLLDVFAEMVGGNSISVRGACSPCSIPLGPGSLPLYGSVNTNTCFLEIPH